MQIHINPTSQIKARLGLDPNGKVQAFFTETCYKAMDKYVPLDKGDLRKTVSLKKDSITYESPYAHYMYKGQVMGPSIPITEGDHIVGWFSPKGQPKHYTGKNIQYHKGGGSYWDKRMWSVEREKIIRQVQNYIGR